MATRFESVNFDKTANLEQSELRREFAQLERTLAAGNTDVLKYLTLPAGEYADTARAVVALLASGTNPYHVLELLYCLRGKKIRTECASRTRQLLDDSAC